MKREFPPSCSRVTRIKCLNLTLRYQVDKMTNVDVTLRYYMTVGPELST